MVVVTRRGAVSATHYGVSRDSRVNLSEQLRRRAGFGSVGNTVWPEWTCRTTGEACVTSSRSVLFSACEDHRLGDAIILSAMTGIRKGEILALEWSAATLAERVLSVRQTLEEVAGDFRTREPKTAAGRRVVTLGSSACVARNRRQEKAPSEHMKPAEVPLVFPTLSRVLHRPSSF